MKFNLLFGFVFSLFGIVFFKLMINEYLQNPSEELMFFTFIPIVFAMAGIAFLASYIMYYINMKILIRNDEYIITNDWHSEYINVTINNVRQLCIIAEYQDEFGRKYFFRSEDVFSPIKLNEFDKEASLKIYVNLEKPKKYYMDYSSIMYINGGF